MGKRGPAPRATHLRLLDGNPSRRPINVNEPQPVGEATPPEHLTEPALKVWERVVSAMPPGFYTSIDSELLANWCVSAVVNAELARKVLAGDALRDGDVSRYTGALWTQFKDSQAQLVTLSSKLGFTPADRASLKVPKGEKPGGKFAGLVGGRTP